MLFCAADNLTVIGMQRQMFSMLFMSGNGDDNRSIFTEGLNLGPPEFSELSGSYILRTEPVLTSFGGIISVAFGPRY